MITTAAVLTILCIAAEVPLSVLVAVVCFALAARAMGIR